ncbi:hypothetical protein XENOCAPTIV_025712 [Xenoophorus captivus]|uniref:Uncharacterized protein n=1 Tax=Xenoophorus captivus TaxID=1517983 RepID=A0ABV0RW80_9TELE
METATAERDREIAALQADLGSVRTELEHWKATAAKYEEEINRLQEAFAQQQQQHNAASQLQGDPCSCVFIYISLCCRNQIVFMVVNVSSVLLDLRQRYEKTEQEKLNIHQELEQCRSNLKLLQDKTTSVSPKNRHTQRDTLFKKSRNVFLELVSGFSALIFSTSISRELMTTTVL